MSILTLAEYKLTPFYNAATQTDANINYYLDIVDDLILFIRGIPFFTFEGDLTDTSTTIEITNLYTYNWLYKGALLEGFNDNIRGKITTWDETETEITVDTAATGTNEDELITIYPKGSQNVAAEMIKYLIDNLSIDQTMKSESIGTYSYTRGDDYITVSGYSLPGYIANKIERFQSMK